MRLGVALGLLGGLVVAAAQIAWTPIFVDGSSQVDLWTQAATGCACPGEGGAECACCARDGACPCGDITPTRCAQCGLEQHCASMCNITIDSRVLKAKSGKTFGQIKSPSLEGPGSCSYLLQPDTGQRVEIQVYRLVSVGRFNGTRCVGGWLELGGAGAAAAGAAAARLCGANERYTPPVVLFADHGASTLHFRVTERTARSQFLAYFSFTSLSNTQGVGFHPRGGSRIPNTDCDWLYQDVSCRPGGGGGAGGSGACVLASPGYPGLYPPHRRCRYLLTTNSVHTRVRIHFISILLPHNHCGTDYLTLRAGSSPAAPLLASLCTERRATLEYPGPNLLLEFNSGAQVPPFDYNGFIARLEFVERGPSSEAPATPPPSVVAPPPQPLQPLAALMDGTLTAGSNADGRWGCGTRIRSGGPGGTRSGHFDTRLSPWRSSCNIVFLGGLTDVVHISLFNYNLRSQACRSVIEVIDGIQESVGRGERAERASLRVCGPALREARDPAGRFVERQAVVSRGPNFTLVVKRASNQQPGDEEFVDGAFMFQDEQHDGTAAPDAACVTTHYGLAAPARGGVSAPAHHHLYWNHEGRLLCSHRFIPAANQSVTIEIQRLERMWSAGGGESGVGGESVGSDTCHTECGDRGCMCNTSSTLDLHDHLALLADDDTMLSCLCGDFQAAWLPVVVRSWSSVRVQYSVAHYTYASRGFDYAAAYSFNDDAVCGQRIFTTHTGEISTKNLSVTGSLNEFFYQQCTWVLDSKVERQLFIEISTKQTKPCWAWNVTVHEWAGGGGGGGGGGAGGQAGGLAAAAGEQLYTFCPRNEHVIYTLPWRLNTVVIRSVALSRQQPLYVIRWRSQVVRANTRLGPPTPAPAASRAPSPRALAALLALAALAALAALTALPT